MELRYLPRNDNTTDLRQSPQYAAYLSQTGWQVLKLSDGQFAYKRSLGPLGSIIKIQRFRWPINLDEVDQLAKNHRAHFIKLEPNITLNKLKTDHLKLITAHGWQPDAWPLIPPKTIVINLKQTEPQLLAHCSENCRRNLRKAQNSEIKVGADGPKDWSYFYTHWQQAAKQKGLVIPSRTNLQAMINSFGKNLLIINCASPDNIWLAAVVMLIAHRRAYYYYATATDHGKQLRTPYLATWTAITTAKQLNCTEFDFEGIADPRYSATNTPDWQGFGEFKAKFGGQEVTYIGSFIKYYGASKIIGLFDKLFN